MFIFVIYILVSAISNSILVYFCYTFLFYNVYLYVMYSYFIYISYSSVAFY